MASESLREEGLLAQIHDAITWDNVQRFLPPPGGRILDAGGGTGRWVVRLARMGYHVTLTNISTGALETAQQHLNATGLLDRVIIERMDIRDKRELLPDSFGLAMAHDAISTCADPQQAIHELARVTRPGGHVIVSVQSRFTAVQEVVARDWEQAEQILATGHVGGKDLPVQTLHYYTIEELAALFEQNNLQVVRVIGRAVFTERLSVETRRSILQDPQAQQRLIAIETRYASHPSWVGAASHFEMVGVRQVESSVKLFRQVWST